VFIYLESGGQSMFRWIRRKPRIGRTARRRGLISFRPGLEGLEDRSLMSANVLQTNLVSDLAGVAQFQDPNLVNPWGIAESTGSPFWVSDNNAGVSTLYNTAGKPQKLVVSIPTPGDPTGATGAPTGTVFNIDLAGKGFMVSNGTTSAPAIFLFATEDGTIAGWNPAVNPIGSDPTKAGTFATLAVPNSTTPTTAGGAVYKGLAIATDASGRTLLYVTNFRSGQVEVYGTDFKPVTTLPPDAFTDPDLPKGYAPFNIQELGGKIYVTYAKQDDAKHDDVPGPGRGFVDVFNLDGSGGQRLISRDQLNAPWGLAIAPPSFGSLAGALLVGNFGDGRINAFDAKGNFLAGLKDPDGEPIQIDGLWALKVGNGAAGGDANTVYFTAGLDHEQHGLFGALSPVAPGTPEGPAEAQAVQAALDIVQLDLTAILTDINTGASEATLIQAIHTLNADVVALVKAEIRFAVDQAHDSGKEGSTHHFALDVLEDIFADLGRLTNDMG
jgi:uncharacterized protein (TIGR03118 family)